MNKCKRERETREEREGEREEREDREPETEKDRGKRGEQRAPLRLLLLQPKFPVSMADRSARCSSQPGAASVF